MNKHLRWFGRITWFGIVTNAIFWVPALFFPSFIADLTDTADPEYRIWLRNVGMLLILVAIWNAAGAYAPHSRPLFAWLVPLARLIASLFFLEVWLLNSSNSSDRPEAFMWFFLIDGSFAVVTGTLLQLGLPEEHRLSLANVKRVLGALLSFPMFRRATK